MKKLLMLLVTIMYITGYVQAQSTDPQMDYIKQAYSKDKKTLVDQYMNLDVQEGAKFWPIYGTYEASREKLAQERFKLINQYVAKVDSLSPATADNIAKGVLNNNLNLEKLNLSTYDQVKKAIGPVKAAKYMQLETYLQTSWRSLVQDQIPLIKDLDKTKQ